MLDTFVILLTFESDVLLADLSSRTLLDIAALKSDNRIIFPTRQKDEIVRIINQAYLTYNPPDSPTFDNLQTSDFSIVPRRHGTDTPEFHCHKFMLIRIPYFATLFQSSFSESHSLSISLDFHSDVLEHVITFAYNNQTSIFASKLNSESSHAMHSQNNIPTWIEKLVTVRAVFVAADYLSFDVLCNCILDYMVSPFLNRVLERSSYSANKTVDLKFVQSGLRIYLAWKDMPAYYRPEQSSNNATKYILDLCLQVLAKNWHLAALSPTYEKLDDVDRKLIIGTVKQSKSIIDPGYMLLGLYQVSKFIFRLKTQRHRNIVTTDFSTLLKITATQLIAAITSSVTNEYGFLGSYVMREGWIDTEFLQFTAENTMSLITEPTSIPILLSIQELIVCRSRAISVCKDLSESDDVTNTLCLWRDSVAQFISKRWLSTLRYHDIESIPESACNLIAQCTVCRFNLTIF